MEQCPSCQGSLQPIHEEVDIGVGVQKFLVGYECGECGGQLLVCNACGCVLDHEPHTQWCYAPREVNGA